MSDHQLMQRALAVAHNSLYISDPNPRVGCVIARSGEIIAEGWTQQAGNAHAEIHALEKINFSCKDADVYVTLEPCSHTGRTGPCVDALIAAKPKRIFVAMRDPNPIVNGRGIKKLQDQGIEVVEDICADAAAQINRGFLRRIKGGRPYIRAKVAASIDGKTALNNGQSQWITGPQARQDVHHWRARSSVMITGVGTVLADDPRLNSRLEGDIVQPDIVVVDSQLRTPSTAKLFAGEGQVYRATSEKCAHNESHDSSIISCGSGNRVNLEMLIDWCAEQDYNEVMIEAGGQLTGAFLHNELIDELIVYLAPTVIGDIGKGMFAMTELLSLQQAKKFVFSDIQRFGNDVRLTCVNTNA